MPSASWNVTPRLLLGLGFALGLAFAGAGPGCSTSSAPSRPDAAAGGNACPGMVDTTVGTTCDSQGMVCSPTFPCGLATVTVRCVCEEGTFQCTDGAGNPFAAGSTPSCGEAGPAPMACPATESAAAMAACSLAENGQQCSYPPECEGGTLAFDRCTCQPNRAGSGFAYDCENACNGGSGPVPDAGTSPPGLDGGSDAPAGDVAAPVGDGGDAGDAGDAGLQGDVAAE